jgi:uncharacterized membrane protein YeaQ/YmgE (transglycosylase-associated protein family)
MLLLAILVIGLAAGWVADLIVHGRMRPESWSTLLLYGLVGSLVGGLLISLLAGDGLELRPSGIIGSLVGALLVTAGWRWWQSRSAAARTP